MISWLSKVVIFDRDLQLIMHIGRHRRMLYAEVTTYLMVLNCWDIGNPE